MCESSTTTWGMVWLVTRLGWLEGYDPLLPGYVTAMVDWGLASKGVKYYEIVST